MAARREHGGPSALTVLEVAEGLRWTDPTLGASLAEHARRLAGDDPTVLAAADRSVVRSLAESDRHGDVVERGVPLLAEARARGDRDDGAAVLVELAAAATGLGDPRLAHRLLDRLGPTSDLPARVGATASAARAEACAAIGDVAGTDAAGDEASPVLFRVPEPESGVVRARIALARGVARRHAGDTGGALSALDAAASLASAAEGDGGRRSLTAVAEITELLVAAGRPDEARERAQGFLSAGPVGPHVATAVGRIRLALATVSADGARGATAVAEDLEAAGRQIEAARAWELVATLAETDGDLGSALAALRRGHALDAAARDTVGGARQTLAALADGPEPLASGGGTAETERSTPRRRRREASSVSGPVTSDEPGPAPALADAITRDGGGVAPSDVRVVEPATEGAASTGPEEPPASVMPTAAAPMPGPEAEPEWARPSAARDELAELLASLTRSVDSSRAAASAMGLEPAPDVFSDGEDTATSGDRNEDPLGQSRHSADPPSPVAEGPVTRPTFDAFSTAPTRPTTGTEQVSASVAPLPDDRFASPAGSEPDEAPAGGRDEPVSRSVSDLLDPLSDPLEPDPAGDRAAVPVAVDGYAESVVDDGGRAESDGRPAQDVSSPEVATPGGSGLARPARRDEPDHEPDGGRTTRRGDGRSSLDGSDDAPGPTRRSPDIASPRPRPTSAGESVDRTGMTAEERPARERNGTAPHDGGSGLAVASPQDTSDGRGAAGPGTSRRAESGRPEDRSNGTTAHRPAPRTRSAPERSATTARDDATDPARPVPGGASGRATDEYDEELALTRATVLAEYHLPDVPMPPRRDRDRPAAPSSPAAGTTAGADVAVPSARRHTSGSMPVPADQRWAPRSDTPAVRPSTPTTGPDPQGAAAAAAGGRGRPAESGARLADLLAEAMDAFRHVGPEAQDGARGPGVGSRRA